MLPHENPVTAKAQTITLADGRTLGFSVFGDPDGVPVIALHGTPGSRLKFADSDEVARRLGLRLISVDRWGYGLSSPHSDGTLTDFGADMVVLADRLGLGQCVVTGVSGGGPYAVATAAAFGPRALALALVSPIGIIDAGTRLSPFHHVCFRLLPRFGFGVATAFHIYRAGLLGVPHSALRLALSLGPAVDRRTLDDPSIRQRLIDTFASGLKPGVAGAVGDMGLFVKPWELDMTAITAPAKIWIGTADRNVPAHAVGALAGALPRCDVTRLVGEGHLWIARNGDVVMSWLATQARAGVHVRDEGKSDEGVRSEPYVHDGRSATA